MIAISELFMAGLNAKVDLLQIEGGQNLRLDVIRLERLIQRVYHLVVGLLLGYTYQVLGSTYLPTYSHHYYHSASGLIQQWVLSGADTQRCWLRDVTSCETRRRQFNIEKIFSWSVQSVNANVFHKVGCKLKSIITSEASISSTHFRSMQ